MLTLYAIDTNVLGSGLLSRSKNSPTVRILDAMLDGTILYVLSSPLLAEYRTVLKRPNIRALHGLTSEEIDLILTDVAGNAIWRDPSHSVVSAPDPGDDHLWALLEGDDRVELITGDRLLLENPPCGRFVILPSEYVRKS